MVDKKGLPMHECALMSYLLESVETVAHEHGAERVLAVHVVMGERAGVDDSLLFYFDLLTPGTIAEGAKLKVRRTRMRFACPECLREYSPSGADFACGTCGRVGQLVDAADDLYIENLEIERCEPRAVEPGIPPAALPEALAMEVTE